MTTSTYNNYVDLMALEHRRIMAEAAAMEELDHMMQREKALVPQVSGNRAERRKSAALQRRSK